MMTINEYLKSKFEELSLFSQEDGDKALDYAKKNCVLFFVALLELKILSEDQIYSSLAKIEDIDFTLVDISSVDINVMNCCPQSFMMENRILPYKIENDIVYALIDNPFDLVSLKDTQSYFDKPITLALTTPSRFDYLFTALMNRNTREEMIKKADGEQNELFEASTLEDYLDAPAVALANTLLEEAVQMGASDIHIEPLEKEVRVRFRIDGLLQEHCVLKKNIYYALVARYKIMSELDIAERRIPQDGKISRKIKDVEFDFRVSTLPIIYGEKIVIRIFDKFGGRDSIKSITHNNDDENKIKQLIRSPNGIILMTGPTGSGKTTTLYTFLKELNKPGVNIQTVEDPVENQIPGINQLQTNTNTGLTFASSLRSILRQDPNIIMVGEIRDEETAHIAVQAAITGHLVFSTIHTNDAVTTITRLIDMNIEPYMVGDSLRGVISQRLVRNLCPHCKVKHKVTKEESLYLGLKEGTEIYEPHGCPKCNSTGYKGRTAVFEIMIIGDNIKQCIANRQYDTETLNKAALKDGLIPLKQKCSDLVKEGITSIEEFNSIISYIDR